jgi:hypothetical protein
MKRVNCKHFSERNPSDGGYCDTPEKAGLRVFPNGRGMPSFKTCEACGVREPVDASKPALIEITVNAKPRPQRSPQPQRTGNPARGTGGCCGGAK